MDLTGLAMQFASGAVGGNLTGQLFPALNLGWRGNALAGVIGGGIGSQLVNAGLGRAATSLAGGGYDPGTLIAQLSGGVTGGIAMALLVGFLTWTARRAGRRDVKVPLPQQDDAKG
jgi:hypothetical protein